MRNLGVSSIAWGFSKEVLEKYNENSIDAIEISASADVYKNLNWKLLEKDARETGVEIWSFHLPFWPFEEYAVLNSDKSSLKRITGLQADYIKKCADIGIKTCVIHPSGEPIEDSERESCMKSVQEVLYELAKVCNKEGIILAIEDLPRTCIGRNSDEILQLMSVDENLMCCFDTNHLLSEEIKDFVRAVGSKIRTLHVSDYDRVDERHWMPTEGIIDWKELLALLDEINYQNVFMYEVRNRNNALSPSDFYENYQKLIKL